MTLLVLSSIILIGCGGPDFRDCSAVDVSGAETLPLRLSETGFYSDIANDVVSEGAIEFTPRFPLWTDGADKRRWLVLPEGGQVDTTTDEWVFPVGTRTFKEFTLDGLRLETRMNVKTDAGWAAAAYVWNEAGDDALRRIEPAPDVAGTPHDVPGAAECHACHGGRNNFTLGFSPSQLDVETRAVLFSEGVLSHPVQGDLEQLEPAVREGLGVLHGNCSHCHNAQRNEQPQATECYAPRERNAFDFTLPHDLRQVDDAPAVLTALDVLGTPHDSKVLDRMSHREADEQWPAMPPLGTEVVDDEGVEAVEELLGAL